MSTTASNWAARKTDEDLISTLTRMDEIHAEKLHLGQDFGSRPIYDALREEALARGLWCDGCGDNPATTLTADGSWMGCVDCATAPTHP